MRTPFLKCQNQRKKNSYVGDRVETCPHIVFRYEYIIVPIWIYNDVLVCEYNIAPHFIKGCVIFDVGCIRFGAEIEGVANLQR